MNLEDVRKKAEFDKQMSAARVYRMRGDYAQAAEAVRQALHIIPDDLEATEFAADLVAARGDLEKAAEIYKGIFEADKSRVSAEDKYAKTILQMAEDKYQTDRMTDMVNNPAKYRAVIGPRNPLVASLLSIAPGFGQMYCGQLVKGIVIFVSVIVLWFFFNLLSPVVKYYPESQRIQLFFHNLPSLAVFFAMAAISIHTYAFVDAAVSANKLSAKETKPGSEPGE